MVLSSAIVCDHDRRIAGDRRSVFPYDRRTFCDLPSAIVCDHMETSLKYTRCPVVQTFAKLRSSQIRRLYSTAVRFPIKGVYKTFNIHFLQRLLVSSFNSKLHYQLINAFLRGKMESSTRSCKLAFEQQA